MSDVKFKISYDEGNSSYTFSKIKESASDKAIYDTALAFTKLQAGSHDNIYKVVDYDITP